MTTIKQNAIAMLKENTIATLKENCNAENAIVTLKETVATLKEKVIAML